MNEIVVLEMTNFRYKTYYYRVFSNVVSPAQLKKIIKGLEATVKVTKTLHTRYGEGVVVTITHDDEAEKAFFCALRAFAAFVVLRCPIEQVELVDG